MRGQLSKIKSDLDFWWFSTIVCALFINKKIKQTNVEKYFIWPLYKWKSILQNGKIVNNFENLYINRTLAFVKSSWKMKSLKTSKDRWQIYTNCKANQWLSVHSKSLMSINALSYFKTFQTQTSTSPHAIRYTSV